MISFRLVTGYKRCPSGISFRSTFISHFYKRLRCGIILKFADDSKLIGKVGRVDETEKLRGDLKKLGAWSKEWQIVFNTDKYKVLHFGHNNGQVHYVMDGKILETVEEERDLGVIIQSNLKVDKQCAKAAKTAHSVLGMIRRSFINKGVDIILPLHKSLVHPRLEYCVQAWSPFLRNDIELLEKVQKGRLE